VRPDVLSNLLAPSRLTTAQQAAVAGLAGLGAAGLANATLDRQQISEAASLTGNSALTAEENDALQDAVVSAVADEIANDSSSGLGFIQPGPRRSRSAGSATSNDTPADGLASATSVDGDDDEDCGFLVSAGSEEDASEGDLPMQVSRYLRVLNETGDKLTVYVQYRTATDDGDWVWRPGTPGSDDAVAFVFEPGEIASLVLDEQGTTINGTRVRIWAVSQSGKEYFEHKDEDLWLVPETNAENEHLYYAADMQPFTMAFAP
jgi:hypothetical protein